MKPASTTPYALADVLAEMHASGELDSYESDNIGVIVWGPRRHMETLLNRAAAHGYMWDPAHPDSGSGYLYLEDGSEPPIEVLFHHEPLRVAQHLAYTLRRCMTADGENLLPELVDVSQVILMVEDERFSLPGLTLARYVTTALFHQYRVELDSGARTLDATDEVLATLINDVGVPEYLLEQADHLLPDDLRTYTALLPVAAALTRDGGTPQR